MWDSRLVPNFRPVPSACVSLEWGTSLAGGISLSRGDAWDILGDHTYMVYHIPYTATFCPYGMGVNTLWYHEDGLHRQYQQSLVFPCLFACLFSRFVMIQKSQLKVYRNNRHKLLSRDCWHLLQHSFVILEESMFQVQVLICFYTSTTKTSHICLYVTCHIHMAYRKLQICLEFSGILKTSSCTLSVVYIFGSLLLDRRGGAVTTTEDVAAEATATFRVDKNMT